LGVLLDNRTTISPRFVIILIFLVIVSGNNEVAAAGFGCTVLLVFADAAPDFCLVDFFAWACKWVLKNKPQKRKIVFI
jgi:hypothetical protein